jgi:ATP-dependent DNA helicase RecQ
MAYFSRLSAMPLFMRRDEFWNRFVDPKSHLGNGANYDLRNGTASHQWDLDDKGFVFKSITREQESLLDVAQSILERGVWTIPTWKVEQAIAAKFESDLGWKISQIDPHSGSLGFNIDQAVTDSAFKQALTSARWSEESPAEPLDEIMASRVDVSVPSSAELQFLEEVIIPTLGFPLLDYLRLEVDLISLGLDPTQFTGQRADFVLDTLRGLSRFKLVMEVDGSQHLESAQRTLDEKRDKALIDDGWTIWRVSTRELKDTSVLSVKLRKLLETNQKSHWGLDQLIQTPRSQEILTCVWGATVVSRIQFLVLESIRRGILLWDTPWRIGVVEAETKISILALDDLQDWFGRLLALYGYSTPPYIELVPESEFDDAHLVIDISVINPHKTPIASLVPLAWSKPANFVAQIPKRKFLTRMTVAEDPPDYLLDTFVNDLFRKSGLREGQQEIISRIMRGQDVVGLLPTGGGKSLSYQLCGLLLGGLTIYVSPLISLLQDQHERLVDLGIDLAVPISSAQDTSHRQAASQQLIGGGIRYLLVSPERFLIDGFRTALSQFRVQYGEVSQVVVDECHCVSEWGHDFRPAYLSLSRIVKERTKRLDVSAPLIALTGTASSIVLADVQRELGIMQSEAVIRAKRLDRPEIRMSCVKTTQKQKHEVLKELAEEFLIGHPDKTEGLLIFCRFIGGVDGVLGVTASLLETMPQDNMRFYCGSSPNWKQFASFRTKKKASELSDGIVESSIPVWALAPTGAPKKWNDVKAQSQREFISGLKSGYQALVATTAFGMGIDKPSVRSVFHFMTPQSPEAYYQEVGRAGRDKNPSTAVLLFSDEDADVTDRILDPGVDINEAKAVYAEYTKKNKYSGGDFIRTFFFHQNSFSGPEDEIKVLLNLLTDIRRKLAKSSTLNFPYIPDTSSDKTPNQGEFGMQERSLEYAIVRLIILGVVRDYSKDYKANKFELQLNNDWVQVRDDILNLSVYLVGNFSAYVRKYKVSAESKKSQEYIQESLSIEDLELRTATSMVDYVYDQIERRRRTASRQMLELARKAVVDPEGFRLALLFYLQASEFTKDLEVLAKSEVFLDWRVLVDKADRPEIGELHGACQRVLESYPTHPGLLFISSVTRLNPSQAELARSEEEFNAGIRYAAETYGVAEAKASGDAASNLCDDLDEKLSDRLQSAFGIWLIRNGRKEEAIDRFITRKPVRDYWLASILKNIRESAPAIEV